MSTSSQDATPTSTTTSRRGVIAGSAAALGGAIVAAPVGAARAASPSDELWPDGPGRRTAPQSLDAESCSPPS